MELASGTKIHQKICNITKLSSSIGLFIGPFFSPLIYDSENVSQLIKSENHMQEKATQYKFIRSLVDRSILIDSGLSYRESKRILLDAVSHANLKEYLISFNSNTRNLVDDLSSKVGGTEFNLEIDLSFCIISILIDTIMGLDASIMTRDEIILFAKELDNSLNYISSRIHRAWLYPDFLYKFSNLFKLSNQSRMYLRNFCGKLIAAREKKFQSSNQKGVKTARTVFIDKYFVSKRDDGSEFSIDNITDDVLSLIGAGFDTTVISLGFVIIMLAINQDVQKKVFQEITEKLKGNNRYLDTKDLNELHYLDQVIYETWRLYPPLPVLGRLATKDIDLANGGYLEKGTNLWIFVMKLHRDPTFYPDPDRFNPENFLPERVKERPSEVYMPFGFGTRKCFGNIFAKLVIKTILCHLLRNYQFHTTKTEEDFQLALEVTLKNKSGIPVSIVSRENIEIS
ncbi:hypothetical protein HHI36_011712 [Cryptolaemus montrouzieri]|uniref:Cytochrome P450 n=1 Tax=Cryptolaemus montrouzieri TaxID=559131 RepID=A0ABD2MMF7_9CUCU